MNELFSPAALAYDRKFAWCAERSSLADISPKSYHLTAFELINLLQCVNFPCFECIIFLKDLKTRLSSSVALCLVSIRS